MRLRGCPLKERSVRVTRALVAFIYQLCIQSALAVKGVSTVEAEAAGVATVEARVAVETARGIAEPNLDVLVAEEVHLGRRATRDTTDKTATLAASTMLHDLRGGDVVAVAVAVAGHFFLVLLSVSSLL